jgi:hypothetical protein
MLLPCELPENDQEQQNPSQQESAISKEGKQNCATTKHGFTKKYNFKNKGIQDKEINPINKQITSKPQHDFNLIFYQLFSFLGIKSDRSFSSNIINVALL